MVEISGPWLLLGHAETRLNSSTAGLLLAVVPMIAAIILTRHGPGPARRPADRRAGDRLRRRGRLVGLDIQFDDLAAVGAVMLVAVGYAIGPIIINRKLADLPPMGVVAASLIVATVLYAPFIVLVWPAAITAPRGVVHRRAGGRLHGGGVPGVLRAHRRGRAGPGDRHHLHQPGGRHHPGRAAADEPFTVGMAIGFPLVILGSVLATARRRERTQPAAQGPRRPGSTPGDRSPPARHRPAPA